MLILASQSPQRSKLLTEAGIPFVLVHSTVDEATILFPSPQITAVERARAKARTAVWDPARHERPAVILGADTVVALGKEMIGKPRDRADARAILSRLQGTTHTVITGHCCISVDANPQQPNEAVGLAMAKVTMRPMSSAEIAAYVDSGESDGRAGAYAIQETGDRFVAERLGGWDTVVGLHIETVARLYRECTDQALPGYRGP